MSIVLQGSTSGSVTLQEPAVAGTTVLTLPAVSGTVITTGSPQSGSVLQVVQATTSSIITSNSTSFISSGLSLSITPKFSTSKILVTLTGGGGYSGAASTSLWTTIYRNSTDLGYSVYGLERLYAGAATAILAPHCATVYDSPATTSATTYTAYYKSSSGGVTVNFSYNDGGLTVLTAMEIAA